MSVSEGGFSHLTTRIRSADLTIPIISVFRDLGGGQNALIDRTGIDFF